MHQVKTKKITLCFILKYRKEIAILLKEQGRGETKQSTWYGIACLQFCKKSETEALTYLKACRFVTIHPWQHCTQPTQLRRWRCCGGISRCHDFMVSKTLAKLVMNVEMHISAEFHLLCSSGASKYVRRGIHNYCTRVGCNLGFNHKNNHLCSYTTCSCSCSSWREDLVAIINLQYPLIAAICEAEPTKLRILLFESIIIAYYKPSPMLWPWRKFSPCAT